MCRGRCVGRVCSEGCVVENVGESIRGGCEGERTSLRPYLVVSATSAGVSNVCEAKNVPLLVQNEKRLCKMRSFDRGPLPPLCLPR